MNVQSSTDEVLKLTNEAIEELKERLPLEGAGKALRIYVEDGGCSGLQYGMVFDEKREDDLVSARQGVSVLVDPASADYLRGSTLDFSTDLAGGGFKLQNPNAQSSCGCGKSFHT